MKIRTKLTLRYTCVTAVIFLLFMLTIYLFVEHNRSETFFRDLKQEGVTKAHLFLKNQVDAKTMQSIYLNNTAFINEVEVAVYTPSFEILYHDAYRNDIVKETPEMIQRILKEQSIEFYEGEFQAIGMLYNFQGKDYIVTAAAYDGYGYENQKALEDVLIILSIVGLTILVVVGYLLARSALTPVSNIVKEAESITAVQISKRLPVGNEHDELGELSIAFNQMLNRLEEAFKAQKMFVSNVSHELRTPMAALIAELELAVLKERTLSEYETAINNVLNDSYRVVKLIEGLLNLAKTDYLPEQIKMKEVRLDELLLDARALVIRANPSYKVELIFEQEAEDDSVITVMGNNYLLTTAFVNLMENNCKFSAGKTSMVQISFWEEHSIIRFSDNGIGISDEDKANLFTPFYRGENKGFTQGHGIGMALTKKIIVLHQGTIEVHSQQGEGTTYVVELPHI
ncbi:MAG: ATP-binding protein [Bacteroides sp.]|nr:ATP-binding protein [Bacteroides sp.]